MKTIEDLPIHCPHCGRVNDLHASMFASSRTPQPDDRSICWKCRGVAVYVEADGILTQRSATPEEVAHPDVQLALKTMNQARRPSQAYDLFQGRR